MAAPFYQRLKSYFESVAKVLRGEADAGSIFPNTSDIGISRELIYVEFLKLHTPSKCNVYLGGFLFGENGDESKQLDVIVSTDTAPQFHFLNKDGKGKSFGPVDGCIGVASIKSTLDKTQLFDALSGIASIPLNIPLGKRVNPLFTIDNYPEWPYKIIYATEGISVESIMGHLGDYYELNPDIPIERRPNIIHVAGKYVIFRILKGATIINPDGTTFNKNIGDFHPFITNPDVQAFVWVINELQLKANASNHINFDYSQIINKVSGL